MLKCSFCDKTQEEVDFLVTRTAELCICDKCNEAVSSIMIAKRVEKSGLRIVTKVYADSTLEVE